MCFKSIFNFRYPVVGILLSGILLLLSCEGMVEVIEVDMKKEEPRLIVCASLDSDGGKLIVDITRSCSIGELNEGGCRENPITSNGSIKLYEDGELIFTHTGKNVITGYNSFYSFWARGISTRAGSTYEIVADIEGYPVASAVAVMPDPPVFYCQTDTSQTIIKSNACYMPELGSKTPENRFDGTEEFMPLHLHIQETGESDFYLVCVAPNDTLEGSKEWIDAGSISNRDVIGTSDRHLLQDNPDMIARNNLLDFESDVFLFDRIIIPGNIVSETGGQFNFLTGKKYSYFVYQGKTEHKRSAEVKVSRISEGSYDYYKSLALQYAGLGFYAEPAYIPTNVKNGYGYFSVYNTQSMKILDYSFPVSLK